MKFKIVIIVTFLLILFLSLYIYKWEFRKPFFEVHFFALRKGRSIFIRSPKGITALIGGGQSSEVMRELTKVSPFYRRKIDYIFLPSATPAQIGGLLEVIDRYEVEEIIMPNIATSSVLEVLQKEITTKKIHIEKVEKGDELKIDDLNFHILFPDKDFKFNKSSLPELGLEIDYKNTGLFLIGNLSKTIQKNIATSTMIQTDENLLEFYTSGSEAKVSKELVSKIQPKFTFTTKEKTIRFYSDGFSWEKGK